MVDTDTVLAMPDMAMVLAMLPMEPTPMATMERGLLMLSLRQMLMLTTLVDTDMVLAMPDMAMVLAMLPMEPTPMAIMERGLLTLSLKLMPMLTTMVLAMDMAMLLPTAMASKKSSALSLIV